jgi:predicted CopG family antitoxin
MSTKTIAVAEDAYEQLRALKSGRESFTDVIRRLTARKPLTEFAGLLTAEEAEEVKTAIEKGRACSRARARQMQRQFPHDS